MPTCRKKLRRRLFERLEARRLLAADFKIVLLPDTQHYAESFPQIFDSQTQWVADNVQSENLVFLSHVGDLVETPGDSQQWQLADSAMDTLDGDLVSNPDGLLPYSAALGNHDYDSIGDHTSANQFINNFGDSRYAGRSWYGGSSPDQLNYFQIFTAGDYQLLNLNLEWEPRESSMQWAQSVLAAHADLPTIVTTHAFLRSAGHSTETSTPDGHSGEQIFQELIAPNPQVFLTLSGHYPIEKHQTTTNDSGQDVFEIVADYQGRNNGGDGWLQLLNFRPDLNRIDVTTYSPWLDQFETDSNSQFSLSIDFNERFAINAPPSAQLSAPQDNGPSDLDPAVGAVTVNAPAAGFELQLSDIVPGVDDSTVTSSVVSIRKDGSLLVNSVDYTFGYDSVSDRITLNSIGNPFDDGDYELLVSSGSAKIADLDGQQMDSIILSVQIDTAVPSPPDSLYFSLKSTGVLTGGLISESEDVVFFDGSGFSHVLDGSDVGLSSFTIDALAIISPSEILLSFTGSGVIPGISGKVDDSDLVKFTATQLGDTTAGVFEHYFDASDVGLSGSSEDVDAVALLANGHLLVSTTGAVTVAGVTGEDEDLLEFTPTTLGENTSGTWSLFFDGSDVGLAPEDVNAVGVAASGEIYLSNLSNFALPELSGKDEDILVFTPSSLGANTNGTYSSTLFFDGSEHGVATNDVYAIHVPPGGPANSAPVAEDDAVTVDEDSAVVMSVLTDNGSGPDYDSDGTLDASSVTVVAGPANGSVSNNADGTLLYTAAPNFHGNDSFSYTVRDDRGAISNVATVSVTVNDVNDIPIAEDDVASTNLAVPVTINVLADNGNGSDSDVDGTLLGPSASIIAAPSNGSLANNGDGSFLYTPNSSFLGTDSFTYTVQDDDGATSNVAVVAINVSDNNLAPTAQDDFVATLLNTPVAIDVLSDNGNGADSDADGQLIASTTTATAGPSNGALQNNGDGTFLFTPNGGFVGTDSFTYTIQDDDGATSNSAVAYITVNNVNQAPFAQNDAVVTTQDTPITIDVLANNGNGADSDVDGLLVSSTVTAVNNPANGALANNGDGTFGYTPANGFTGTDSFSYTVSDDEGAVSNVADVFITVVEASASTFYFTLNSTTTIDGQVAAANEDVVAFDGANFSMLFDGSDVGVSSNALGAFAVLADNEILLNFSAATTLPGISETVTEHDIVKFTASQLGADTSGQFELYFDGSDVGLLEKVGEIDAIDLLGDGRLVISTIGSTTVAGIAVRDEDMLAFAPTSLGSDTTGNWELYFDGSQVGISGEDIDAASVGTDGTIYLSVQNDFSLPAVSGDDEDVLAFTPTSLGVTTSGTFDSTLYFDGSQFNLTSFDVRAMDIFNSSVATLRASSAVGEPPVSLGLSELNLTQSQMDSVLTSAISMWHTTDPNNPDICVPPLTLTVANLPGDWLAMTDGAVITIDVDAGGGEWFVDDSPLNNDEFSVDDSTGVLTALGDSAAAGRYDLLTVVSHEIGHVLGLQHSEVGDELMSPVLSRSIRRLPVPLDDSTPVDVEESPATGDQLLAAVDIFMSATRRPSLWSADQESTELEDVIDVLAADFGENDLLADSTD